MAEANGAAPKPLELIRTLELRAREFGFFQALRLLECAFPDLPRIGLSRSAAQDPIRLGQQPDLSFAPTAISDFEPGNDGVPARLSVYFFGLLGPNGALPLHLTEFARQRVRQNGDRTFVRFLDMFHHRFLTLFYRAWAMHEPTTSFDRPGDDHFGERIAALFGLGMPSLRGRDAAPDAVRLHFAAHFACQTRHADGLRAILSGYFKLPVAIREFMPGWMALPRSLWWRLGATRDSGVLGATASPGMRVWACHHKFRIELGPLSLIEYQRFLPGGRSLDRLTALVRSYVGDELAWDVRLVLQRKDVPALELGRGVRLGWTSWIISTEASRDANDLVLDPASTFLGPGP